MHLIRSVVTHSAEEEKVAVNSRNIETGQDLDSSAGELDTTQEDENAEGEDDDVEESFDDDAEEDDDGHYDDAEGLETIQVSEDNTLLEDEDEEEEEDEDNDPDDVETGQEYAPKGSPSPSTVSAKSDAEAISMATKAADESYQPSQSLLSSSSPYPLIRSVDGISLKTYNPEPSRFSAKDVIVPLRGNLNVPIHVTASGSVVDYQVECKDFDIGFGVVAEREEGVTVVKEKSRQDCHLNAISGRFLVGSVPCALIFSFDNEYSWFREKKVSYKIKVSPPTIENIIQGRRTRAKSALSVVQTDKESAETRLESVSSKHGTLMQEIERLETELAEKKKSLGVVEKEEGWLKQRVQLRDVQESLLTRRLTEGWEDEAAARKDVDKDTADDDGTQRAEI